MLKSNEVRQKFLDFFEKKGHKILPSSSLVPTGDPTLLFTSAGMVQFKNMFLGKVELDFRRAATSQKCFRTNDIERVGYTSRHQTFFEMLGNFSFGDYFKKEAIEWAWEFLTKDMNIAEDRLYASIFKDDDESFQIWRKILPAVKIIRLTEKDNFWNMGETGPCGPCSEILYDRGEEYSCGPDCKPGCDCDRFIELWNLVFTQFDKTKDGELLPLPQKNIDTGMGLERLCVIIQNVSNNFETDLLKPVIDFAADLAGTNYGEDERKDTALKVIADHTRGITFLMADGILPSNEGRGYVLRRILRRAVRHAKALGIDNPFIYKVTGKVIEIMKAVYPELAHSRQHIAQITLAEEERFKETLQTASQRLDELIQEAKTQKKNMISGIEAFKLYDTYGFPIDLTLEIARENNLSIDEEGFNKAMEEQKMQSRQAWKGSGAEDIGFYEEIHKQVGDTVFRGYEVNHLTSRVLKIIKENKTVTDEALEGEEIEIIVSETPFYGESGGQTGDTGKIVRIEKSDSESVATEIAVTDTKRPLEGLIIHIGKITRGKIKVGNDVEAIIDYERRHDIARSHTATHILHAVLREVLGEHVKQSGSFVEPGRFRFDFSHLKALSERELNRIEELVNAAIRENFSVLTSVTTIDEAKNSGAIALFGEKYQEKVRMVMITSEGLKAPSNAFSIELCAGTHLRTTGEIGLLKLTNETSIAAGVRRIEALVGEQAYKFTKTQEDTVKEISSALKTTPQESLNRTVKLIEKNKELEREIANLKNRIVSSQTDDLLADIIEKDGVKIVARKLASVDRDGLRTFGDKIKDKLKSGVVVLATVIDNKGDLLVMVTQDMIKKGLHAGKIIKEVSSLAGGSGGGKPDFAQAGAKDINKIDKALESVPEIVSKLLK